MSLSRFRTHILVEIRFQHAVVDLAVFRCPPADIFLRVFISRNEEHRPVLKTAVCLSDLRVQSGKFGAVVRAKGIVRVADTLVRFDAADGLYAFTEEDGKTPKQSVFIGRDIDADAIYESMGVRRSKALYANLLINGRK